jgi:uncharacterized protein YcnI
LRNISTRALVGVVGVAAAVSLIASPAAAHVTVNPREAEQGGFAKLTFRMPTERDNASSIKLELTFPESQPLSSVSVKRQVGWTYQVDKVELPEPVDDEGRQITETVSKITWTAQKGFEVKPGEFAEFEVSAGRLPTDEQMVFKAIQIYDSGEVVRWIEEAAPGATARPERPAPVLTLVPRQEPAELAAEQAGSHEEGASGLATIALIVSIVALLLGAGGLASGLAAKRRSS